jgi:hypothetical protein
VGSDLKAMEEGLKTARVVFEMVSDETVSIALSLMWALL